MWIALITMLAPQVAAAPNTSCFQQGVDYRIEATLDDATSVLRGRARLHYTNRSRTRIDTLYFHEHLNAFRPNSKWAQREAQFNNRRFQDLGARATRILTLGALSPSMVAPSHRSIPASRTRL